jgi:outer membrane autotransporter protein
LSWRAASPSLFNPNADSSTITVTSGGEVGALSDRAIISNDNNPLTINNSGTITGYIELADGDDTFNNEEGGVWELRNYADSDTEEDAIADFGGGTNIFVNEGTLRLLSSAGYEGFINNLTTFIHSGVIDLADGEAGDELHISGDFQTAGGALYLDVELADASSEADLLFLDNVIGSGPTLLYITNAGGQGGLTSGNGIKVIDVDDTSSIDAFALGKRVIAGAYEYQLEWDGEHDWYLQSALFEGTGEYPVLLSGSLLAFHADLGPLHQRLNQAGGTAPQIQPASWRGPAQSLGPWLQMTAAKQNVDASAPYGQTVARLNVGIDGELQGLRAGRLIFGGFAGLGHAAQDFDDSDTEAESATISAGAHARYSGEEFYSQAIVKFEHQNERLDSAAATDAPFDIDLLGLSWETGLHFGSPVFSLTPYGRLSYLHAWAGSFEDDQGVTIDLENADSLRGELAVRLGKHLWQGAAEGHASLDAGVRHEVLGETEAGVSGLAYTDELPGTLGFLAANMDVTLLEEQLRLGLRGEYAKGDEAQSFGASLSLDVKL